MNKWVILFPDQSISIEIASLFAFPTQQSHFPAILIIVYIIWQKNGSSYILAFV